MKQKTPKSEADVSPQIVQALHASGCQIWRNSQGCAKLKGFWVRFGVGGKGGSDYLGFLPVRVTPAMVGAIIPVFVAVEAKRPVKGVASPEQVDFIKNVQAAGGIAGFARSWEEARGIVSGWFSRFAPPKKLARRVKKA